MGDITPAIRRLPDRCSDCGRFVGYYPIGFYDDQFCGLCYDRRADAKMAREEHRRWRPSCNHFIEFDDPWAGTYCKLPHGHDGEHSAHYPVADNNA